MMQRFVSASRALSAAAARPAVSSALRGPVRAFSAEVAAAAAPAVVSTSAASVRKRRVSRPRPTIAESPSTSPEVLARLARLKAAIRLIRAPAVDTRSFPTKEVGERGTLEWRMQFERPAKIEAASPAEGSEAAAAAAAAAAATPASPLPYSPWHHINLLVNLGDQYLRYVNEIPKGTRPKMEIATKEPFNPIKQDVKKGALRDFTYGDLPFNYGALPQTWENPHKAHVLTGKPGDNDPIDVVEVSDTPIAIGAVRVVRVLGAMALLDEGETDFKILAIDTAHPMAKQITSPESLETHMPGKIAQIRDWFKMYKTTDGKPENEFAFNGEVLSAGVARGIIWDTHHEWGALLRGETDNGGLSLSSKDSELRLPQSLQSSKLLLSDLSFVVKPAHRKLMTTYLTTSPGQRYDPALSLYDRLRVAYESAVELASKSAADAVMMEPTLRAFRKTFSFYLSHPVTAETKLPAVMPGTPVVPKTVVPASTLVTVRTPKARVNTHQSQLVNAMVDPRARDFMLLFNLMSREQTSTQVVYTQLANVYRHLVKKVDKEQINTITTVAAKDTQAAAADTDTGARAVTYVRDLRVICSALRTYFIDRNVVTREPVPVMMPIVSTTTPVPAAATPAVAPVVRSAAAPTPRPRKTRSTDAKTTTSTTNTTIAKSEGRERKQRNGEPRKPRETRERKPRETTKTADTTSEPAAKAAPAAAAAAAAPSEESVGDLLAKVMSKLNSTPI